MSARAAVRAASTALSSSCCRSLAAASDASSSDAVVPGAPAIAVRADWVDACDADEVDDEAAKAAMVGAAVAIGADGRMDASEDADTLATASASASEELPSVALASWARSRAAARSESRRYCTSHTHSASVRTASSNM